jgi:chemotaxis response regulator CheB
MILESEPDIDVVGEAGDGCDAVRQAARLRPTSW